MERERLAAKLGAAATFMLGVALPVAMAPASKSSPLLLAVAAALAMASALFTRGAADLLREARSALATPAGLVSLALLALMAVSIGWAHDRASSFRMFLGFAVPLMSGALLLLTFPSTADRRRVLWWPLAASLAAGLVIADLWSGLLLRNLLGARAVTFAYNRTLVTLVVLLPPLLALIMLRGRPWHALLLLPLPVALAAGESGAAVLGFLAVVAVLPVAWLAPRWTRWLGLAATLLALATAPLIGTLSRQALGAGFHQRLASAHSDDRVAIWLSFEAAAQRRPLLGNGFGSSLDMQKAPVAREIAPERVTLLGASHPHNAFLQLWVELGALGALLAGALCVFWFGRVGAAAKSLQPYLLAWTAVVAAIALVSHGAWQAWWIAAIAASAAAFAALAEELRAAPMAKPL